MSMANKDKEDNFISTCYLVFHGNKAKHVFASTYADIGDNLNY